MDLTLINKSTSRGRFIKDWRYNYQARRPRIQGDRCCVGRRTPQRGGILVHTRRDGCVWRYTPFWQTVSPCRRGCSVGSSRPSATAQRNAAQDTENTRWLNPMCSDVPPLSLEDTDHTAGALWSLSHGAGTWGFHGRPRRRTRRRTVKTEKERQIEREIMLMFRSSSSLWWNLLVYL